jgi:hypothetical protein
MGNQKRQEDRHVANYAAQHAKGDKLIEDSE